MVKEKVAMSNSENSFEMILKSASGLPFVRIDRGHFLN